MLATRSFRASSNDASRFAINVRPANDATRVEVALLRARALLRLDRPDKAIEAIRGCSFVPLSGDELITSQMLLGSAYVKLGQPQRGASILEDAMRQARRVHPTVSAESTLNLGIAWYVMGEPVKARELLTSVAHDADIVHVRALEYQGWLALFQSDFTGGAEAFRAALDDLDRCDHRDRFVEANLLQGLASVYPELLRDDDWPRIQLEFEPSIGRRTTSHARSFDDVLHVHHERDPR